MTDPLSPYLPPFRAAAARASRVPDEAEDLLQDALLEAIRAGRCDLSQVANQRWLLGTIRNLGAMTARSAVRRRRRESDYSRDRVQQTESPVPRPREANPALEAWRQTLPPSLRRVANLALAGHDREEIAWLLGLGQATLRQRIAALRRRLVSAEGAPIEAEMAPSLAAEHSLQLGLIRRALLPVVVARQAAGVHDPDGHLLLFAASPSRSG